MYQIKQDSEVELERARKDLVPIAYPVCLVESITHMKPGSRCKEAMGSLCVWVCVCVCVYIYIYSGTSANE